MASITLKHVTKTWGSVPAVNDVNLAVADGEFLVLLGPSGCGKSTLLRNLNRMNDLIDGVHHEGDIRIGGQSVREYGCVLLCTWEAGRSGWIERGHVHLTGRQPENLAERLGNQRGRHFVTALFRHGLIVP